MTTLIVVLFFRLCHCLTKTVSLMVRSRILLNFALSTLTFGALSVGLRQKRKHKSALNPVNQYGSVKA